MHDAPQSISINPLIQYSIIPVLSYASFQAHAQEPGRFDREFHRELPEDFLAVAVDDQSHRVLRGYTSLIQVEDLIGADL